MIKPSIDDPLWVELQTICKDTSVPELQPRLGDPLSEQVIKDAEQSPHSGPLKRYLGQNYRFDPFCGVRESFEIPPTVQNYTVRPY